MRIALAFSLILSGIAMVSCVSGPQIPPDSLVVERSELGRPRWVDSVLEVEPSAEKLFVHSKFELLRLDLGIRQTQASGIAAHCKLLADRLRIEIQSALEQVQSEQQRQSAQKTDRTESKVADAVSRPQTGSQAEAIEKFLSEYAASRDCPELEPKDVYWEAVRRLTSEGPRTSYDVYVLLSIKQVHFDEVLAMAANSLKLSGRADLGPVAEILMSRMSQGSQRGTNE